MLRPKFIVVDPPHLPVNQELMNFDPFRKRFFKVVNALLANIREVVALQVLLRELVIHVEACSAVFVLAAVAKDQLNGEIFVFFVFL